MSKVMIIFCGLPLLVEINEKYNFEIKITSKRSCMINQLSVSPSSVGVTLISIFLIVDSN